MPLDDLLKCRTLDRLTRNNRLWRESSYLLDRLQITRLGPGQSRQARHSVLIPELQFQFVYSDPLIHNLILPRHGVKDFLLIAMMNFVLFIHAFVKRLSFVLSITKG